MKTFKTHLSEIRGGDHIVINKLTGKPSKDETGKVHLFGTPVDAWAHADKLTRKSGVDHTVTKRPNTID